MSIGVLPATGLPEFGLPMEHVPFSDLFLLGTDFNFEYFAVVIIRLGFTVWTAAVA